MQESGIYLLGGNIPNYQTVNTVERAAVNADGSLGPWPEQPEYGCPYALPARSC